MAEIGAIASIIGVVGAGAKLSIILFEFASTVGSAGAEVKRIGIEISLFCSVLKQLQSTLTKAKAYRYSLSALQTTQEILDRCQEIFKDIEDIVDGLRKRRTGEAAETSMDLISRAKWTFKRSQVQVLRTTLESCKITLHLMLTTLEFAQKIGTRRTSTIETQADDEHEQTMTHSLIIAHQCTVETLERLEDGPSPPLTPGASSIARTLKTPTRYKPSRSFDSQKSQWPLCSPDIGRKRASVWINDLIFETASLPPGFRRHTWGDTECLEFLDQQQHYFLRKWTDQGENLDKVDKGKFKPLLYQPAGESHHYNPNNQSSNTTPPIFSEGTYPDRINKVQDGMVDSGRNTNAGESAAVIATSRANLTKPSAPGTVFKSFLVSANDPCYKVLPAALKKYNINAPWEDYALYVVYGDMERRFEMDEKPLQIFKELDREGKKPTFMLRKLGPISAELTFSIHRTQTNSNQNIFT